MTALKTRKPTGKPSWPLLLLAGGEKCGKSYAAAALSTSDLVDRTFWLEIGEGSADLYGALPGSRYEIVEHDGTYASMLAVAKAATEVPTHGKPHVLVVDSMTELWDLLCGEQQAIATARKKDTITMDQWNAAKRRWRAFVDVLRHHHGPVILTARFDQVTVVEDGKPKTEDGSRNGKPVREWKVRAEKNLGHEVDGIVEIPKPRQFYLTGVRSLAVNVPPGGHLPLGTDFTLDQLLRDLGLGEPGATSERNFTELREDLDAGPPPSGQRRVTAEEINEPPVEQELWPDVAQPGSKGPKL